MVKNSVHSNKKGSSRRFAANKRVVSKKRVASKKKAIVKKNVAHRMPVEVSRELPPSIVPSDLTQVTEDQLGVALANIRREIRNARESNTRQVMRMLRDAINRRLDRFVFLDYAAMDSDPRISENIAQLGALTLEIQRAVRKMQTVKKAIDNATKIIGYADKILKVVGSVTG
ncbi:MAG: hypothetical protein AB2799_22675 [Candidatus Thiodiazotropha sp.]